MNQKTNNLLFYGAAAAAAVYCYTHGMKTIAFIIGAVPAVYLLVLALVWNM